MHDEHPVASSDTQPRSRWANGFSDITGTAWAFLALAVIIAALAGYIVGSQSGGTSTTAAEPKPTDTAKLAEMAPPGGNGTIGDGPVAKADGSYDATIVGPGGDVRSQDDIYNVARRDPADPFAIGPVDAPVVLSEFSDFECPFCALYTNNTEPEIMDEYVKKGLVRIEWNDLPINGPNAIEAAKAGRAAAAQGKFFAFKHALYEHSKQFRGHPENTIDNFMEFAKTAGVKDLDRFKKEATDDTYQQPVMAARQYGSRIGINGTPGFIIGGQFVSGAQPIEVFHEVIRNELAKVASGEVTVPKAGKKSAGKDNK